MGEGSLRCDANISVRLIGVEKFGTKVEVKNMNSSRNVKNAIDFEIKRQIQLLENGEEIVHETRGFNAANGETLSQRHKEEANDYRYFPEPDLQPIIVTQEYINKVKNSLPPLPNELLEKFTKQYKLSHYDANIIVEDKKTALYFNELCKHTPNFKTAANLMNGVIKSYLNENAKSIDEINLKKINLKYIVLCEKLSISGILTAGIPDYKMKTLIIDVKFDSKYFERVLHHEVFHIINDGYKDYFDENEWSKLNDVNFKYTACSTCSNKTGLYVYKEFNGFKYLIHNYKNKGGEENRIHLEKEIKKIIKWILEIVMKP